MQRQTLDEFRQFCSDLDKSDLFEVVVEKQPLSPFEVLIKSDSQWVPTDLKNLPKETATIRLSPRMSGYAISLIPSHVKNVILSSRTASDAIHRLPSTVENVFVKPGTSLNAVRHLPASVKRIQYLGHHDAFAGKAPHQTNTTVKHAYSDVKVYIANDANKWVAVALKDLSQDIEAVCLSSHITSKSIRALPNHVKTVYLNSKTSPKTTPAMPSQVENVVVYPNTPLEAVYHLPSTVKQIRFVGTHSAYPDLAPHQQHVHVVYPVAGEKNKGILPPTMPSIRLTNPTPDAVQNLSLPIQEIDPRDIEPEAMAMIRSFVTTVHVHSNTSSDALAVIPPHVKNVKLHRNVSTKQAEALPDTVTTAHMASPGVSGDTMRALRKKKIDVMYHPTDVANKLLASQSLFNQNGKRVGTPLQTPAKRCKTIGK